MRALRVVGLTEDGEVVLEDPVRLERYTVQADERLRAAARGDLSRLGQIAIELESQLRPREIQARIRAGASVEQVATAAGVPEQKIERFAYPVLTERFRTADNAQRAHPMRADGPDNRTLAEVVAHTLRAARPDLRGREVGLVEGRRRPLGGRPELARGTFGQPGALGVPAGGARRHGHRARRARERPGRGTAGAAAADGRRGGRHDPAGGGAAAHAVTGGAVARRRVRQLPRADAVRPRPGPDHEPHPVGAVAPAPPSQRQTEAPAERAGTYRPTEPTPIPVPRHGPTRTGRPNRSPTRVRRPRGRTPSRRRPRRIGAQTGRRRSGHPGTRRKPVGGADRTRVDHVRTRRPGHRARGRTVADAPAPADESRSPTTRRPQRRPTRPPLLRSPPPPRNHRSPRSSKRRRQRPPGSPRRRLRPRRSPSPSRPRNRTPPTRRSPRRARRPRAKRRRTSRRARPSPRRLRCAADPPRPPSLRSRRRPPRRSAPARASR